MNKKLLAIIFLALIIIAGICVARISLINQNKIPLSDEEIESILTLHIIDETDEEATQVEEAPSEPINYPPVNITKVSFRTDQDYLYIKFEFIGQIPVKKEDPVAKIIVCILMDTDCNDSTVRSADHTPVEYKGGPGTNYVVLRVPMDVLGLQSGQQIIAEIHAEAESKTYHHYAFDALKSSLYEYTRPGKYFLYSLQILIP